MVSANFVTLGDLVFILFIPLLSLFFIKLAVCTFQFPFFPNGCAAWDLYVYLCEDSFPSSS